MKNRIHAAVVVFASVIVFLMTSGNTVNGQAPEDAQSFVKEVARQVVGTIKDAQLTDEQRWQRYAQIFDHALDSPLIARIAISHHLRKASPEQKEQYFNSFRGYIIGIYADRFGGHGGARLEVISALRTTKVDTLVNANISGPKISTMDTVFRVRNSDNGYKIVDVVVDGVSLVLTKRAEFSSIVYREGIKGLLETLAARRVRRPDPTRIYLKL